MKLSRLLENHQKATQEFGGLETNFGDSALLSHNRIYKNIRKLALAAGFQYTVKKSEESLALPLSQLKTILESKQISYTDNVSVLKKIEKQIPQSIEWDEIRENLKRNYLFHESCHAVAFVNRLAFKKTQTSKNELQRQQLECLWVLLEESFANACELIALVEADETLHKIFYEMNSYTYLNEEKTTLKRALAEVGDSVLLKVILYSYLFSNFLYTKIEENEFRRILKLAAPDKEINSQQSKILKSVSKIAFTLDENFRQQTTCFYLKLYGLTYKTEQLFDFDVLTAIENESDFKVHVEQIVKKALYGETSAVE